MSKSVYAASYQVTDFTDSIGTVGDIHVPDSVPGVGGYRSQSPVRAAFEQAKIDGFQAGLEEGLRQGQLQFDEAHAGALQEFRNALELFVSRAQTGVDAWYAKTEVELSTLAVEIARRAICAELETSRDSIYEITRTALAEVRHGNSVRVRVNPFDVSVLEARRQQLIEAVAGVRNLEITSDPTITAGCEIDTDGGMVDATVDTYLNKLEQEAA